MLPFSNERLTYATHALLMFILVKNHRRRLKIKNDFGLNKVEQTLVTILWMIRNSIIYYCRNFPI